MMEDTMDGWLDRNDPQYRAMLAEWAPVLREARLAEEPVDGGWLDELGEE
jgi:hypothetical protein